MAPGDKTAEQSESRRGSKDQAKVEEQTKSSARKGQSSIANVATPSRARKSRDAGTSGGGACTSGDRRGPSSALEDLMRRKGVDEAWNALEEMQQQGLTTDKYTVSRMLMKTLGDGRTRLNPSRVYRGIFLVERFIEQQPKDVDEVLFNALLDTCCRLKDLSRLEATVKRMRDLKVTPSPVTLGILVKTYGQAGDLQKVLQVWEEMEKQRGQANAVTYGCMIDACVKCGNLDKGIEIFKDMQKAGKHRNTILYTTLIKGYGLEKDLASALKLFREMPDEGVPYNTITYNSILDACIKCGDLPAAEGLLREMTSPESHLEPDLITFSTLLKGYCHLGDLDKALQVAEAIKARGLRSDELVYNTLMDGCVKANDVTAGVGLFEEMVQNGMCPSAITHSILARLYQRAGYEQGASEAVAQLYQHHGIERPSGGDRGKGAGRRCSQRSPGGAGEDRSGFQSPGGSPTAASATMGLGLHRDRLNSGTSCTSMEAGTWSTPAPWGSVPPLPLHHVSADVNSTSTAPSPASGTLGRPPTPYLPIEAIRGPYAAQPYHTGSETPYGHALSSPIGSPHQPSYLGSPMAAASSPTGAVEACSGFGLPPSLPGVHVGFALSGAQGTTAVGSPMHNQGVPPPMPPPWQFLCGSACPYPEPPAPPACPAPTSVGTTLMQHVPSEGAGQVPQVYSVQMLQAPGFQSTSPTYGQNGITSQPSPFPMPLSPPHDYWNAAIPGHPYFESWHCAMHPPVHCGAQPAVQCTSQQAVSGGQVQSGPHMAAGSPSGMQFGASPGPVGPTYLS